MRRILLGALLGAVLPVAVASAPVVADDTVPTDRIVAALVGAPHHWRPDAARAIAAEVPAVLGARRPGWSAYFCGRDEVPSAACPGDRPLVVFHESDPPAARVDHEYRHAWQNVRVRETEAMVRASFAQLAARDDAAGMLARRIVATRPADVWHWNHWLIGEEGLRWDYGAVPEPHRSAWFSYGHVHRVVLLPTVQRSPRA